MGMKCSQLNLAITFGFLLLFSTSIASADDISHYGSAPKSPSCDNLLRLVKVKILVNGVEGDVLGGLTARFGGNLPTHAEDSIKLPAVFANPLNGCSSSSSKVYLVFLIDLVSSISYIVMDSMCNFMLTVNVSLLSLFCFQGNMIRKI
ncbi:signal peptide peptidase-like 3 [Camellia sinensis]|uniref:Uncharacterized protein n=1 Tax=Camellia sinensis var. sinensis TaxID=542762 RepID=A0A4S4DW86_CAMSN|nr:signal peptide peptidase-like 3 [Camellia sinensis]THG07611.1 hypothetical protein TEA_022956 [Camellia sinensis var. sinensis]